MTDRCTRVVKHVMQTGSFGFIQRILGLFPILPKHVHTFPHERSFHLSFFSFFSHCSPRSPIVVVFSDSSLSSLVLLLLFNCSPPFSSVSSLFFSLFSILLHCFSPPCSSPPYSFFSIFLSSLFLSHYFSVFCSSPCFYHFFTFFLPLLCFLRFAMFFVLSSVFRFALSVLCCGCSCSSSYLRLKAFNHFYLFV